MKKTIILFFITIFIITGCSKKYEKEELSSFKMSYHSSTEKSEDDFNRISIDFRTEEMYIEYVKYSEDIEEKFTINDVETLTAYINSIITQPDNYNRVDNREELQIVLWNIKIKTEENSYWFTGFDDYPEYWDEMWQVLLDVSDAESLEDFGF